MAKKRDDAAQAPEAETPRAPRMPNAFKVIHAAGFPCGAAFGRYGSGWGPMDCKACLEALGLGGS